MKFSRIALFPLALSIALLLTSGISANGDDEDEDESDQDTVESTGTDSSICAPGLEPVLSSPSNGVIGGWLGISVAVCSGSDDTASINVEK